MQAVTSANKNAAQGAVKTVQNWTPTTQIFTTLLTAEALFGVGSAVCTRRAWNAHQAGKEASDLLAEKALENAEELKAFLEKLPHVASLAEWRAAVEKDLATVEQFHKDMTAKLDAKLVELEKAADGEAKKPIAALLVRLKGDGKEQEPEFWTDVIDAAVDAGLVLGDDLAKEKELPEDVQKADDALKAAFDLNKEVEKEKDGETTTELVDTAFGAAKKELGTRPEEGSFAHRMDNHKDLSLFGTHPARNVAYAALAFCVTSVAFVTMHYAFPQQPAVAPLPAVKA